MSDVFDIGGFSFAGSGPNRGVMFVLLKPWADRKSFFESVVGILYGPTGLMGKFQQQIPEAQVFAFNPPAIQGVGNFGGFQYELQDTGNIGLDALTKTAYGYIGLGNRNPDLRAVFTAFRNDSPQLVVDVNRLKAQQLGIPLASLFSTMQVDLGSLYVNDFDYLNRSYRVYVQADTPFRSRVEDLQNIYVRSAAGAIVPLSTLVTAKRWTRSAARSIRRASATSGRAFRAKRSSRAANRR